MNYMGVFGPNIDSDPIENAISEVISVAFFFNSKVSLVNFLLVLRATDHSVPYCDLIDCLKVLPSLFLILQLIIYFIF